MQFIEMSGKTLRRLVSEDELQVHELDKVGVTDESVIRVNRQGDVELRRRDRWDVIGGLLGDFDHRVRRESGLEWADCGQRACGVQQGSLEE
jgi:hypothetical protein